MKKWKVETICRRFGLVNDFAKFRPIVNGCSRARVKVDLCDVKSMPQFVPLMDLGGAVYPV